MTDDEILKFICDGEYVRASRRPDIGYYTVNGEVEETYKGQSIGVVNAKGKIVIFRQDTRLVVGKGTLKPFVKGLVETKNPKPLIFRKPYSRIKATRYRGKTTNFNNCTVRDSDFLVSPCGIPDVIKILNNRLFNLLYDCKVK